MLFADEATRHKFHQEPALLQIVCQLLESALYQHAYHVKVFDSSESNGFNVAMLSIEPMVHNELLEESVIIDEASRLNAQFKRQDGILTVQPEIEDFSLLSVRVTSARDFLGLN